MGSISIEGAGTYSIGHCPNRSPNFAEAFAARFEAHVMQHSDWQQEQHVDDRLCTETAMIASRELPKSQRDPDVR
ncbi:hypothetical protein [Sphingomonas sp.]|uniref:hypothetical protein n=1 Tax=Sphingomonas sp. TaxID=28214 RepID=UPI00185B74E3|nr:hypothetical protein [Sphingomonas sp.]MBA4760513.1 hypothetical protein [Sphingomonas sp.]